jgi:hypothetical protein
MTVLPQLERALAEACRSEQARAMAGGDAAASRPQREIERLTHPGHDTSGSARPRRHPRRLATGAAVVASVLAVALVAGGALLLVHRDRSVAHHRPAAVGQLLTAVGAGSFAIAGGGTISHVYTFAGSVYVVWQPPAAKTGFELARIDPATGRVLASLPGPGTFGSAGLIDGAMWSTDTLANDTGRLTTTVTRSDPRTLLPLSSQPLTGLAYGGNTYDGALADTGPWTWVSYASGIGRFSSANGHDSALRILIPNAEDGPLLAGSPAGPGGLVVFVSRSLRGRPADGFRVQLRDPVTGTDLGEAGYPHSQGHAGIQIAGIIGRRTWVLWGNPASGPLSILDLDSPENARRVEVRLQLGPDALATIGDHTLWIAANGVTTRVRCANPDTGELLGTVDLPHPAVLLGADGTSVYTRVEPSHGPSHFRVTPVPTTCRR